MVRFVALLAIVATAIPCLASAAIISNEEVHIQYDYHEFFAAADGKEFKVVVRGNPTSLPQAEFEQRLMQVLQKNLTVGPRTTFTTTPANTTARPDYHLALVFNTSSGLLGTTLCKIEKGSEAPPSVATDAQHGDRVSVSAAYCRNDQPMTEAFARTDAASMDDPAFGRMFSELLAVLFPPQPIFQFGPMFRHHRFD